MSELDHALAIVRAAGYRVSYRAGSTAHLFLPYSNRFRKCLTK